MDLSWGRRGEHLCAKSEKHCHSGRVSALPQGTGDRLLKLRAKRTLAGTAAQLNVECLAIATGALWSANAVANTHRRLVRNS